MDSRVDNQADRPPHLVGELPELGVRILFQPELGAETLGVESPPFDERGISAVAAGFSNSLELLRYRGLKMMDRDRFVGRESFHRPGRAGIELVSVDEVLAGAVARGGPGLIIGGRL